MKLKQLSYKATTETGDSAIAELFEGCDLWRILLDVKGKKSTLMLSSVEKRINNKRYTDANRKTEAIAALWSGLRAYGFTSKEAIRL